MNLRASQEIRVDADRARLEALRSAAATDDASVAARLEALQAKLRADDELRARRDREGVAGLEARAQAQQERAQRAVGAMELRLRRDAEGLAELNRVAAERGPDAPAVQLGVFPPAATAPSVGP